MSVTPRAVPILIALAVSAPAPAVELTLAVDVPADLGGATYLANQTIVHGASGYSLGFDGPAEGLGPDVNIDALERIEDGSFLFSTDTPFTGGGSSFEARDVVRFAAGAYSLHTSGAGLGLPPSADINALARTAEGDLVLSFDAPVTVGTVTYLAGDLVRVAGGALTAFLSAAAMGLPPGTNVAGVELTDDGRVYLQFDAPVDLGGATYLPGDIVVDDGTFGLHFRDAAFPAYAAATDFAFPASPGTVDNLLVAKSGSDLLLSWDPSCSSEATDYAVYEGAQGLWASHAPAACTTGGTVSETVNPAGGDRYFLVVPINGSYEGSYGSGANDLERPAAAGACRTDQKVRACS